MTREANSTESAGGSAPMATDSDPSPPATSADTSASAPAAAAAAAATPAAPPSSTPAAAAAAAAPDMFSDPEFLQAVLGSLPGVDPNDEQIRNLLETFQSTVSVRVRVRSLLCRQCMQCTMCSHLAASLTATARCSKGQERRQGRRQEGMKYLKLNVYCNN